MKNPQTKILVLFGTRPEAIKLAPVIFELKRRGDKFQTCVVSSSQHTDLLAPFLKIFNIETDEDLRVMTQNQTPNQVLARVLEKLDAVFEREKPDLILVQGDTTTALAGALAAFHRRVKIGHVEAGLRSGNAKSPFPEEMNRRLISQVADFHFAATARNRATLLSENVGKEKVFLTGNTVVGALKFILEKETASRKILDLLKKTEKFKRILLTTHRRENFGDFMRANLLDLKRFVARHTDVCILFPVHPNPSVREAATEILSHQNRIFLLEPVDYIDFITLMRASWLVVSDSGGVQEEAPSLGKPVLVLRENTERPEAVEAGVAKLAGGNLAELLEENYRDESWIFSVKQILNPFGDGTSAKQIVGILEKEFSAEDARIRKANLPI